MKYLKPLGIVSFLGFVSYFLFVYFLQPTQEVRVPASSDLEVAPIGTEIRDGAYYLTFTEDSNICDGYNGQSELSITLEPVNFASLSSQSDEPQQIEVLSFCDRPFESPVFMKDFCSPGLLYDYRENGYQTEAARYILTNGLLDIFPPEWKIKQLSVAGRIVSMENQLALSQHVFSCESL